MQYYRKMLPNIFLTSINYSHKCNSNILVFIKRNLIYFELFLICFISYLHASS